MKRISKFFFIIISSCLMTLLFIPVLLTGLENLFSHSSYLGNNASAIDAFLESPSDPVIEAVKNLSAQEVAAKINRDYKGWKETLPSCPCRQQDVDSDIFVRSSWWARRYQRNIVDYHPGGEYDYRQTSSTLEEFRSKTNPNAVAIKPGQQCIYDKNGMLLNRGPGAGTPDIFAPEGTDVGDYYHTDWDVNPFKEMVGDSDEEVLENVEGLRLYHRTWTPDRGKDANGNACPLNPAPEERHGNKKDGRNFGDPHLFTFDGYRYSFQLVGEFIISRSDDDLFEVQVRQVPISSSLSVDSAIAMKIGTDRVALYADELPDEDNSTPVRINSIPVLVGTEFVLPGGGIVYHRGNDYVFQWPTGERLVAQIIERGETPFLNLAVYVFESQADHLSGLLGNANGNRSDELRFRDGHQLETRSTYGDLEGLVNQIVPVSSVLDPALKAYFCQLSNEYGRDWRVSQEESLFDYAPGKNTETYNLGGFPAEYLTLSMIPESRLRAARQSCFDEGVEEDFLEGCVFDVAFSGFDGFARAAAQASQMQDILEGFGINLPVEIPEDPGEILENPGRAIEDVFNIF